MADKKPVAKTKPATQHEEAKQRESRASFVFVPDNKRISDPIKIQRRLSEVNIFPYTFVIGADPQLGLMAKTNKTDLNNWDAERVLLSKCIDQINKLNPKPRFFVMIGDMCDSPPTGNNEYAVRRNQERDFFTTLDSLDEDIFFIAVSGEHDLGDDPTHSTMNRYRLSFGQDFFDFVIAGVRFIVLNSQYYINNTHVVSFADDQERWLDEKLREGENGPLGPIIFMHVPPFVKDVNEPDSKEAIVKARREKLLKKLLSAGVKYIFCGHLHKNAKVQYTVKSSTLEVITTTAIGQQMGTDKPGFRFVRVYTDRLEHNYIPMAD